LSAARNSGMVATVLFRVKAGPSAAANTTLRIPHDRSDQRLGTRMHGAINRGYNPTAIQICIAR
jgi:hypothetical protein